MELSDHDRTISLKFTKFPQHLLIPGGDNSINIQAMNSINKQAYFKFDFEGENLDVQIPNELNDAIQFGPGESKDFEIKLTPMADGYGKLSMFVNWMKMMQYTVKIKKVRDKVPKSRINKILSKKEIKTKKIDDNFDSKQFLIPMSKDIIKKAEKELTQKEKEYQSIADSPTNPIEVKKKLLEEIDNYKMQIARGYLSNKNFDKSMELTMTLSDEIKKATFKYDLIRAFSNIDLNSVFNALKELPYDNQSISLIKKIALDLAKLNPDQAPKIAYLIQDSLERQNLIRDIIIKAVELDYNTAIKICTIVEDDLLKIKVLFHIAYILNQKNLKSTILEIIRQIIELIEKSSQLNLSEHHYKNPAYELYNDAIHLLAELDSPQAADHILTTFELRDVKDKVSEDLLGVIYVMIDEIKTKFEPLSAQSQYYLFNTLISNITDDVRNFSAKGGNISNNLLIRDSKIKLLLVSLFSYNFSIFPIIDRIYADLKFNHNQSIAYYIFPSKENHNENELRVINNSLKSLIISNLSYIQGQVLLFNLDFIPYLGKPTIILSSEQEFNNFMKSKINLLGDSINVILDDSLFKGGRSYDNLVEMIPQNKCKIMNLILSYEFINDYNIFKSFIQSLI